MIITFRTGSYPVWGEKFKKEKRKGKEIGKDLLLVVE